MFKNSFNIRFILISVSAIFVTALIAYANAPLSTIKENDRALRSGNVLYLSVYTHEARPQIDIQNIQDLTQYANAVEPQTVTYSKHLRAYFKDDKFRFDVEREPSDFYPEPIHRSYIYDGEKITLLDHVLGLVNPRKPVPYRMSNSGTLYLPPQALGYDVDGVMSLAAEVRSQSGELPSIHVASVGNTSTIMGTYSTPQSTVELARIEYHPTYPSLFKRCTYRNPVWGEIVDIEINDIQQYGEVFYPQSSTIRQINAPSLNQIDEGEVISEQVLTVLEASFNDGSVTDDLFSTEPPEGYNMLDGKRPNS